jgi:hypothetical protein
MNSTVKRSLTMLTVAAVVLLALIACGNTRESPSSEVTRVSPTNMPEAVKQATADKIAGHVSATNMPVPTAVPQAPADSGGSEDGENSEAAQMAFDSELVVKGEQYFGQFACASCHSTSGQVMSGPRLNGLYGHEVALSDGTTVTADASYIRESILDPNAKVVDGFPPGMMAAVISGFQGQLAAGDTVDALVAYIASLK